MNKREVNIEAAKMLASSAFLGIASYKYSKVDIFNNPADCLAVVKMLREQYDVVSESFDGLGCFVLNSKGGYTHVTEFKGWLLTQKLLLRQ